MADNKRSVVSKLENALRNAQTAWRVILIIAAYSFLAARYLGTGCLLASTTGLPCPGCGITRSAAALIRGDVAESLYYHPLLVPTAIFAAVYVILALVCARKPRFLDRSLFVCAGALIIVYAVRMILMFPDTAPLNYNYDGVLPRIVGLFR